jgi:hypothetical protein
VVRLVDPRSDHPIYGDHGFLNKTAEVSFPLSSKMLLLMSWQKDAREFGIFARGPVDDINRAPRSPVHNGAVLENRGNGMQDFRREGMARASRFVHFDAEPWFVG